MIRSEALCQVYVTKVDDTYRVAGTRISLDSLVYLYREGISPEGMVESYPAFTLEQVHDAGGRSRRDPTSRITARQRRTDRETAADAPCESNSRLTPT